MSRSFRHTRISGITTAESEKWYKMKKHREERAKSKDLIRHGKYDEVDTEVAPYSDWEAPKDGRQWLPLYSRWWERKYSQEEWRDQLKKSMRK